MKADTSIALLAFVVSIIWGGIGLYQYKETFRASSIQNKQSVKPILVWERSRSSKNNILGITLRNKGIGPAILIGGAVFYENSKLTHWNAISPEVYKCGLIPEDFNVINIRDLSTAVISTSDIFNVFTYDLSRIPESKKTEISNKVNYITDKISLNLTYLDCYDDTFHCKMNVWQEL